MFVSTVNNIGHLTQTKATVKNLKLKQLTTFINKAEVIAVAATIPDGNSSLQSTAALRPTVRIGLAATTPGNTKAEYIRGKKLSLIEMDPRFVQKFELTEEEMPFLFVGKKVVRFERGSVEVQQIVDSYIAFKELSGESEDAMVSEDGANYV